MVVHLAFLNNCINNCMKIAFCFYHRYGTAELCAHHVTIMAHLVSRIIKPKTFNFVCISFGDMIILKNVNIKRRNSMLAK